MADILDILSGYSIVVPVIAALKRYMVVQSKYKPFIWIVFIGLPSEVLAHVFMEKNFSAASFAKSNMYILAEFILYLQFFKNVFYHSRVVWLKGLLYVGILVWLTENIFFKKLFTEYDYYFQVSYSLVLALLAIEAINEVLLKERGNLVKNALFLIAACMVVYYTFDVFVEIEMHFATVSRKAFFRSIFAIQQWINCFVNLIFALAILWIPTKKNFSRPSF